MANAISIQLFCVVRLLYTPGLLVLVFVHQVLVFVHQDEISFAYIIIAVLSDCEMSLTFFSVNEKN